MRTTYSPRHRRRILFVYPRYARSFGTFERAYPLVSGCPEFYPDADIVHLGELGDAIDRVVAHLDAGTERPRAQLRFETRERLPLAEFPTPRLPRHVLALGLAGPQGGQARGTDQRRGAGE